MHLLRRYFTHRCDLYIAIIVVALLSPAVARPESGAVPENVAGCYLPVRGGWRIRITDDPQAPRANAGEQIGVVLDDARRHCRPLFPPADKSLVLSTEQLVQNRDVAFRPIVLCDLAPRFMLDLHKVWGRCGHLLAGLHSPDGATKWFCAWSELDIRYVDGRLSYVLRDPDFSGVVVKLDALPLAGAVGMLLKIEIEGAPADSSLVWTYGGITNGVQRDPVTLEEIDESSAWEFTALKCADNTVAIDDRGFHVGRPGKLRIVGGSSWKTPLGCGDPATVLSSPGALVSATAWLSPASANSKVNAVVVQQIPIPDGRLSGYVVFGAEGGDIDAVVADPQGAELAAIGRNATIADRIVTQTPDPYLDAAVTTMAFSTEGTWADPVYIHAAYPEWREPFVGWRGYYGPLCYGWINRVRQSIQTHAEETRNQDSNSPDFGGLGSYLGRDHWFHYNMSEVFFDMVRRYFYYSNDIELMRRVYPVLQGIAAWESRRLQPENESLYENSLNTWISDGHWYIRGQSTSASSYMLSNYRFLAELAAVLGENSAAYTARADAIYAAMQRELWLSGAGVFAESVDTLGNRQVHPSPELPSIYHSAEFGAASPLQIYQMLHWARHNLRCESMAAGAKGYWNSNWKPNNGDSYLHTTHDFAHGEQMNFALTHYQVGQADEAYALLKSGHCGIFNGSVPGGLGSQMHTDGRVRKNPEFADSVSMWGRAVVEGLFGILPERQRGLVKLSPQFPRQWQQASIAAPHFGYQWRRSDEQIVVEWNSPLATAVLLRLPLAAGRVQAVRADQRAVDFRAEPGIDCVWLSARSAKRTKGRFTIDFALSDSTDRAIDQLRMPPVSVGERLELDLRSWDASDFLDPQGVLNNTDIEQGVLHGEVRANPGSHLLFLLADSDRSPRWRPVPIEVRSQAPPAQKVWSPPATTPGDLTPWTLIDLGASYNARLTDVLEMVSAATAPPALPAHGVNHMQWHYYLTRPMHGGWGKWGKMSDAAWRRKVGDDQIGWTRDGIPFKSAKEGANSATVSLTGAFPASLEIPVGARGTRLYLMLSGITFPMQSHVVNVRVTLHYADHDAQTVDFVNPFSIGDCWQTRFGRHHHTPANGFENIGGRFGPAGSADVDDLTQPIKVDTEAHLVEIPLRPDIPLVRFEFEAYANDIAFGLMGATLLK